MLGTGSVAPGARAAYERQIYQADLRGPGPQERVRAIFVFTNDCRVERATPAIVKYIRVSVAIQEHLNQLRASFVCCQRKRRLTLGRVMERRAAIDIFCIDQCVTF